MIEIDGKVDKKKIELSDTDKNKYVLFLARRTWSGFMLVGFKKIPVFLFLLCFSWNVWAEGCTLLTRTNISSLIGALERNDPDVDPDGAFMEPKALNTYESTDTFFKKVKQDGSAALFPDELYYRSFMRYLAIMESNPCIPTDRKVLVSGDGMRFLFTAKEYNEDGAARLDIHVYAEPETKKFEENYPYVGRYRSYTFTPGEDGQRLILLRISGV